MQHRTHSTIKMSRLVKEINGLYFEENKDI
jgi:hypothetical protein